MKSCREMRLTAWKVLSGKWFWRLLTISILLESVAQMANLAVTTAFRTMSITLVSDFITAKVRAAQGGLGYSLPTAKAYFWMAGGFLFQVFIWYIFAAIIAFGVARALLKACADEDNRWFADSLIGFVRPLEATGILVLSNLLVFLAVLAAGVVFGGLAVWFIMGTGISLHSPTARFILTLAILVALLFAIPPVYAYRQAWFLKCEDRSMSAVLCLRESRRMMRGFKAKAFFLDLSFLGWMLLAGLFVGIALIDLQAGYVFDAVKLVVGAVGFFLMVKVMLGMFVARAVFFRELPQRTAPSRDENAG